MNKNIYKIVDDKGRVLIPHQLRQSLGINKGDIVKLTGSFGKIGVEKVTLIEAGEMSEEAISEYIELAAKNLPKNKIIEMASFLIQKAQLSEERGEPIV